MKVRDLNNDILFERNFRTINKELSAHINKLESDAKEVNLTIVNLMVKKSEKLLTELDNLVNSNTLIGLDEKIDKITKILSNLKTKFQDFINSWKDNEFEKETMEEATKILKSLVDRITIAISSAEDKIQDKMKKIVKQSGGTFKKHIKIPKGAAQDLKTKKKFIAKQD